MSETGQVPSLQEMADRMAITDVINKHSRGVDRADSELLKTAYWPDAEVAYGAYNGPAHPFCEMLPAGITRYAGTAHRATNISIDLYDNDAVVESYVAAYHYLADPDGTDSEMTYLGRYIDHMQKRVQNDTQVWKIQFRRVVMDWNQNANATAILSGPPFEGLARGARKPNDPLYEMQQIVSGETNK